MRFLALPLLCVALASCDITSGAVPDLLPQPSPAQLSTPQGVAKATAVTVPTSCKQKQVDHQKKKTLGMDAHAAYRFVDHLLSVANGRIRNGNDCIDQQAAEYAKGLQSAH